MMQSTVIHRLGCALAAWIFLGGSLLAADSPAASDSSDAAIFAMRTLPEPLVRCGGLSAETARAPLIEALAAFEARPRPDDFSALEQFVSAHPQSPWAAAVQTNLGLLYYRAGYFSRTMPAFLAAWEAGKNATDHRAKALADRAAGEYTKMLARLGRYTELKAFLQSVKERQFIGQATELIAAGREGAALMEKHPEKAFRCGPLALSRILAAQKSALQAAPAIVESKSTMDGISLADVGKISQEVGLRYQPVKRSAGAPLILPSVIHWKVGHYAALLKLENGRYLSEDPTFENATWHSPEALEAESSGYFLVPAGPLPPGWTAVSTEEAGLVFGKGTTGSSNPDCTDCFDTESGGTFGGGDPNIEDPGSQRPRGGSPGSNIPKRKDKKEKRCCRMANFSMHSMLVSLHIVDTPVGYDPPYGPPIEFAVVYNHREAGQPSNFNYANYGPKWSFNWLSYITDDPAAPAVASQAAPGGGTRRASGYDSGTQTFAPQYMTQSVLQRTSTSPLRYEITYPDGSKEVFGQPDGSSVAPRKVFLTQRIDPAGNAATLSYDGQLRLTQITDAIGQVTTLSYELPGDSYKITKVTDPFGRHADFTYDGSNRLIKIRDVIGIESQFTYSGSGDFINTLTTPYGTTTFTTLDSGRTRRLTATDPQGDMEVLEYNENGNVVPASDPANTLPVGVVISNTFLYARNSYYWSKKAWKENPNDYTKAYLYHWQHTSNFSQADQVLESEKPPLEGRIWYNYPNQQPGNTGATAPGSLNKRTKIGRRLDDGNTQLDQYTYNVLGQITSRTDPLGRVNQFFYAANNQDLLYVTQQTASGPVTLASYTWNAQHLPLTMTDADGQTVTYTYNGAGQVTSVTNAKNETTTYIYYASDAAGKQRKGRVHEVDPPLAGNGDIITYDYDSVGRVASVTWPDGYFLTYNYDALDRVTRVTFPDGTYTETTFLALDPQTWRDRLGRVTNYVYNSIRQLVSVTDPANRTTQLAWCRCGEPRQFIDALNRVTSWKHDAAGRVTSKVYPDGSAVTYAYQPFSGRLLSITDERGQVKTIGYNVDGTFAGVTYTNAAASTPNLSYTYDPYFQRRTSMTDGTGVTSYGYYPIAPGVLGAGKLATIDGPLPNDTITYTYDQLGRATGKAINGAGETWSYDELGRPVSIVTPLGTTGFSHVGATSRLDTVTFPNGMVCTHAYHPATGDFQLQRMTHTAPGNVPVNEFTYDYDAHGRITTWTMQDGALAAETYAAGYDNADRLTSFSSNARQYAYGYDAADNRLTETIDGATATAHYNALNEMLAVNSASPPPARSFTWDAEDRLVAIDYTGSALRSELAYDGFNRCVRIVEKDGASIVADRRFVWCDFERCEERDGSGAGVVRRFFPEGEQVGGQAFFYARDHLGSVRQMTDGTGAIRARYAYDPYGRRSKLSGDAEAVLGFTGHFTHVQSGLALAPFRAYDPNLGRWLSRDPVGISGGLNLYGYVENRPIGEVDPYGLRGVGYSAFSDSPKDQAAEALASRVVVKDDEFLVIGHGSPKTLGGKSAQELYDLIKDLPGFKDAKKIVLFSCNGGYDENSIGAQLAKLAQKSVAAPKGFVHFTGYGAEYIITSDYKDHPFEHEIKTDRFREYPYP